MSREDETTLAHILNTEEIRRDDIAAFDIDAVYRYWDGLRDDRIAPPRRTFHLEDLPPQVVPRMAMVDFLGPPLDYYYRFFGTKMTEIAGRELTGKTYYADKIKGYGFVNAQLFPILVERKQPLFHQTTWESVKGLLFTTTTMRLPLSDDGEKITGAVTANIFKPAFI